VARGRSGWRPIPVVPSPAVVGGSGMLVMALALLLPAAALVARNGRRCP